MTVSRFLGVVGVVLGFAGLYVELEMRAHPSWALFLDGAMAAFGINLFFQRDWEELFEAQEKLIIALEAELFKPIDTEFSRRK